MPNDALAAVAGEKSGRSPSRQQQAAEIAVFLFLVVPSMVLSLFAIRRGNLGFTLARCSAARSWWLGSVTSTEPRPTWPRLESWPISQLPRRRVLARVELIDVRAGHFLVQAGEGRAIPKFNVREFAPLHRQRLASGRSHAGMIVSRELGSPQEDSPSERTLRLLNHFTSDELTSNVVHLEQSKESAGTIPGSANPEAYPINLNSIAIPRLATGLKLGLKVRNCVKRGLF